LVADDDPEFRELMGRLLAASGLTIVGEAGSVEAAVEAAARLEPSALLLDVELPDGDGVTLARQLAALPWHLDPELLSNELGDARNRRSRSGGSPTCRLWNSVRNFLGIRMYALKAR
jgi:CheY-like chemotaxis protein